MRTIGTSFRQPGYLLQEIRVIFVLGVINQARSSQGLVPIAGYCERIVRLQERARVHGHGASDRGSADFREFDY
jgi:hypothetical protein